MALADKELGKDVWAVVWTIKCVDVATLASYILTHLSDRWCKVSYKHRLTPQSPLTARFSRQTRIRHHVRNPISSSPASYRERRACGRRRAHQFSVWNRRSRPDLLRYNNGVISLIFHVCSINFNDISEGAVYSPSCSPSISWDIRRGVFRRHITSLVIRQTICSTWTPIIHARPSPCDRPRSRRRRKLRNVSVSVGSRLGKPRLRASTSRPSSFPDITSIQPHWPIYILIPNSLTISLIKTTVHKQLFLRRRTRAGAANGGGSVLSAEAGGAGLDATQTLLRVIVLALRSSRRSI